MLQCLTPSSLYSRLGYSFTKCAERSTQVAREVWCCELGTFYFRAPFYEFSLLSYRRFLGFLVIAGPLHLAQVSVFYMLSA